MSSINKVILVGRLGRDPEVRYMSNGEAVANFSIATSETWKDRSGEKQERTEWHNIVMYRKLAEIAGQYLKKGSQAYIEGRIQSRKYMGKDGVERTAYEIVASEMKMLGGRNDTHTAFAGDVGSYDDGAAQNYGNANNNAYGSSNQSSYGAAPARQEVPAAPARAVNTPAPVVDNLDDDIPF